MLALVAGCGFQVTPGQGTVQDGGPGARQDATDATVDPIDASIDAPIDMGVPAADQDGDTIGDPQDNCVAIANTDQRNHDADPFGDACDRCPHLPSPTDPDGDGDGVGDACDPRPSNNGDERVLWAGFYDAAEINGWGGQGTFTVSGGFLVQATGNTSGYAPPGDVNVPFVMTEVVIDNLVATNGSLGIAVNSPTNAQFECTIVKTGANVSVRAREQGGDSASQAWAGSFTVGQRVTFRLDMASDVDCRAIQGATNIQRVASTNSDPTGRTYLGTEGIAARFDYLFVVDEAP